MANDLLYYLFLIVLAIAVAEAFWFGYCWVVTLYLSSKTVLYDKVIENPKTTIAMVGDSFVQGVGVEDSRNSFPGRLSQFFPDARVKVNAVRGVKLKPASSLISMTEEGEKWDTLILFCGGMNIVDLTREEKIREHLTSLLRHAKKHAKNVVYCSPGNAGIVPVFHFPFSLLYERRSKEFHAIAAQVTEQEGVVFIGLFNELTKSPLRNKLHLYASDFSHLNDKGMEVWFENFKHAFLKMR